MLWHCLLFCIFFFFSAAAGQDPYKGWKWIPGYSCGVANELRTIKGVPDSFENLGCSRVSPAVYDMYLEYRNRVDGGWCSWNSYGTCFVSCGNGTQMRNRTCTNPKPSSMGKPCHGEDFEVQNCVTGILCPSSDGQWGEWSTFQVCIAANGTTGQQNRTRSCDNPAPRGDGASCSGNGTETQACANGGWSAWSNVGSCVMINSTNGYQNETRNCTNPAPLGTGNQCAGMADSSQTCFASTKILVAGGKTYLNVKPNTTQAVSLSGHNTTCQSTGSLPYGLMGAVGTYIDSQAMLCGGHANGVNIKTCLVHVPTNNTWQ